MNLSLKKNENADWSSFANFRVVYEGYFFLVLFLANASDPSHSLYPRRIVARQGKGKGKGAVKHR